MIDFEWYRSFIHVYQQRSVSNAAKVRFLTQPAVSQHIAALEAELQCSLFIRAPRQMVPTDAGKELYTQVVGLIDKLEELSLTVKHVAGEGILPHLKIGGPTEYITHNVIPHLPVDLAHYQMSFGIVHLLIEQLGKGELDLVIATKRIEQSGIVYVPLATEYFYLVTPINWGVPDENLKEWVDQQPWIAYGLELPIIRRYYQTQFGERPPFKPTMIVPNIDSILAAVKHGKGISVLPDYLIEEALKHESIQLVAPQRYATNTMYLAHRVESKYDPLIKSILDILQTK